MASEGHVWRVLCALYYNKSRSFHLVDGLFILHDVSQWKEKEKDQGVNSWMPSMVLCVNENLQLGH